MATTIATSARFATFASQSIAFETGGDKSGGYTNDPKDSGGETKWGISKRSHPNVNIKALTYTDALKIYETQYWHPLYDFIDDLSIAFKIYDMGILTGRTRAVKTVQRAINMAIKSDLAVDGVFGPLTVTALNLIDNDKLYENYLDIYSRYFHRIAWFKNKRFLNGWLNRLNWKWEV